MIPFSPQYNNPSSIVLESEFLNNEGVDRFLELIKNIPYEQASIFTGEDHDNHRDSKIKWIPHEDPFLDLYYMCADFINNLNSFHWKFDITNSKENFQYTEYNSNVKGHYDWHVDIGPGQTCCRKLSMVVQLSDPKEYEGGDLLVFDPVVSKENFPYKKVPKKKGSVILLPSFMPHKVTPVTGGTRKSLVWWVGGIPLK